MSDTVPAQMFDTISSAKFSQNNTYTMLLNEK
jgi:hypothetical protein